MLNTMKRMLSTTVVIAAVSLLSCSGQEADFPEVDGWALAGSAMFGNYLILLFLASNGARVVGRIGLLIC